MSNQEEAILREALRRGYLDEATLANYLKLEREKRHFESTVAEKRKRDKAFGKMVKSVMKQWKKVRF